MHKRGDQDSRLTSIGRKMLGALKARKGDGVETLSSRAVLNDGTVVTAEWAGDIPRISIKKTGDDFEPVCEIFVESGLVDLGNDLADARFGSGVPTFTEDPAMLHFGTSIDCIGVGGGLNGKITLSKSAKKAGLESGCIGSSGDAAVESKLSSPDKKKCQALLPASCWTGLMHRYIAALYGSSSAKYEMAEAKQALVIKEVEVSPYAGNSWGIVEIPQASPATGKEFVFVSINGSGNIQFRRLVTSECGTLIRQFYNVVKDGLTFAKRSKLLTIWLSEAKPGPVFYTTTVHASVGSPSLHYTIAGRNNSYAYCFSANEPKVIGVCEVGTTNRVARLEFVEIDGDTVTVTGTSAAHSGASQNINAVRTYIKEDTGKRESRTVSRALPTNTPGVAKDTPLRAWYGFEVDDVTPLDEYIMYDYFEIASAPTGPVSTGPTCSGPTIYEQPFTSIAESCTVDAVAYDYIDVSAGIVVKKNGAPYFSSIKTSAMYRPTAGGSVTDSYQLNLKAFDETTLVVNSVYYRPSSFGVTGATLDSSDRPNMPNGAKSTHIGGPGTPYYIQYTRPTSAAGDAACLNGGVNSGSFIPGSAPIVNVGTYQTVDLLTVDADAPCANTTTTYGTTTQGFGTSLDDLSQPASEYRQTYTVKAVYAPTTFSNPHRVHCAEILGDPRSFVYAHVKAPNKLLSNVSIEEDACNTPYGTGESSYRDIPTQITAFINVPAHCINVRFCGGCGSTITHASNTYHKIAGVSDFNPACTYCYDFTKTDYITSNPGDEYNARRLNFLDCAPSQVNNDKVESSQDHELTIGVFDGAQSVFTGDYYAVTAVGTGALASWPDVADITCPLYATLANVGGADPPVTVSYFNGSTSSGPVVSTAGGFLFNGYVHTGQVSLLGDKIAPDITASAAVFTGNSLGMDRNTITGGYSAVNTPSFIGWA